MLKFIGRSAAQQDYENVIKFSKRHPAQILELQTRLALYLRKMARQLGVSPDSEELTKKGVATCLISIEVRLSKMDALQASTAAKSTRREIESLVGATPNTIAMAAVAGYTQMLGHVSKDRRLAIDTGPKTKLNKDEQLLFKFRELLVAMFDGVEVLLLTDAAEVAEAQMRGNS